MRPRPFRHPPEPRRRPNDRLGLEWKDREKRRYGACLVPTPTTRVYGWKVPRPSRHLCSSLYDGSSHIRRDHAGRVGIELRDNPR